MKKILLIVQSVITFFFADAQNVGIGTATPLTKLHVYNGASGATPFLISPLTVENNDHTYINLLSPAVNETGILFGLPVSSYHGGIVYNHVNTPKGLQLRTNGNVTRMVIDSAGNVGIGNSTPAFPLSFAPLLGDKISLWSNSTNSYGFGIQGSLLQIHSDIPAADIAFGYGSSAAFTETMRVKGNGLVGIGTSTPVASAKLDVTSTNSGFLPPRMTSTQRDAISSAAEGLIIYNTTSKAVEFYNGTSWLGTTHYIGESYGGGIVFYVYENGQHGLIAATADQSTGIQWYNGSFTNTNAIRDGIAATSYNTEHIIVNQGAGNYAAMVCAKYNGGGYGDWYLPSKYELNLLYLQKNLVGGFTFFSYWSSTEFNANSAWLQGFNNGLQTSDSKNFGLYVRAVRAF